MSIFFPSSEFHDFMERVHDQTLPMQGYDSLVFERSGKPLSELQAEEIHRCITVSQSDIEHFVIDFFGDLVRAQDDTGLNVPRKWFEISGLDMSDGQFDALHVVIT